MASIVSYISGHGFGHAVRVSHLLRALWQRQPDLAVHIRTLVPPWLFDANLRGPFTHTPCRLDAGVVQEDSLSVDPGATLRSYRKLAAASETLVATELAAISSLHPHLILADIPALAFDIAARAGLPAVALANFSWDWIYADYARDFPAFAPVVRDLRRSYGRATMLLRLPFAGDLSAFPHIRDIPLVARRATLPRAEVRSRLGLPAREPVVILSFGGIGLRLGRVPVHPRGVTFILPEGGASAGEAAPHCRRFTFTALEVAGVTHEDLVAASDAVMTKPGYGIVAECIANRTPIVYTARGRFAEYERLVEAIQTHLPHAFIANDDLRAGRWTEPLESILAQPRRDTDLRLDGADVAADTILSMLNRK